MYIFLLATTVIHLLVGITCLIKIVEYSPDSPNLQQRQRTFLRLYTLRIGYHETKKFSLFFTLHFRLNISVHFFTLKNGYYPFQKRQK